MIIAGVAALLKVLADILRAIDSGDLAVVTLLDPSAAFDTVDHSTLLCRLRTSYGFGDSVFAWFASYLNGRLLRKLDLASIIASLSTRKNPKRCSCQPYSMLEQRLRR